MSPVGTRDFAAVVEAPNLGVDRSMGARAVAADLARIVERPVAGLADEVTLPTGFDASFFGSLIPK